MKAILAFYTYSATFIEGACYGNVVTRGLLAIVQKHCFPMYHRYVICFGWNVAYAEELLP